MGKPQKCIAVLSCYSQLEPFYFEVQTPNNLTVKIS